MKRLTISSLAMASTLLFSANSNANDITAKSYFGINYEMITIKANLLSNNYGVTGLGLKGGVIINPNFAIEGKFGIGIGSGTGTESHYYYGNGNYEINLDNYFAAYAVGVMPVTPEFNAYIKGGYASINGTQKWSLGSYSESGNISEGGISYILGSSYRINHQNAVNVEYGSLYSDAGDSATSFNIGFTRHF